MTDYERDQKAHERAERIWPWVVFGLPIAVLVYAGWVKVIGPIAKFLTGSAS